MSKRSERREADRIARKLAFEALRQQSTQPEAQVSEAQLAANRANAQLSTGPATPAGKAKSSQNALKHGLTGQTVLLPSEDAAEYQRELDNYLDLYEPANDEELRLVQSQNDCAWRISRIQRLETAILLKGHLELADKYEDHTRWQRTQLIAAEAYLKYERQLRNLNIQEARLRRVMEKDRAELLRLQALRKREEQAAPPKPRPAAAAPATQPENGFEFSTPPVTDPQYQKQAA